MFHWASSVLAVVIASGAIAGPLTGRVESVSGPVGGARVSALRLPVAWRSDALSSVDARRAFLRAASPSAQVVVSAKTSSDGHFSLSLPPHVRVGLWVDAGERGQALVEEVSGAMSLVITLGPATLLEGDSIVRGAPGYPYPDIRKGISVVAVHTRLPLLVRGQTDANGVFKLGYVPEGDYLVVAAAPDLLPELATLHLPVAPPPPPPPPTRPVAKKPLEKDAGDDALEAELETSPRPRMATLGLPDSHYHHHGQLFFDFFNSGSMVGVVTDHGRPAPNARVRLADTHSRSLRTRTTDGAGRFRFGDTSSGRNYCLEVTLGESQLRECVQSIAQVGGHFCYASQPATAIEEPGPGGECRFRIAFGQPAPKADRADSSVCSCDASDFDALTDAGTPSPDAGR